MPKSKEDNPNGRKVNTNKNASLHGKIGKESGKSYSVGKGKPPKETQFSSENQPENSGRKPSLLKKYIVDNGVSIQDVRLILKGLIMDNTVSELMKISDDENEPMMTRTIIKAYLKDFEAGRIDTLNSILDRVYGKSAQDVAITGSLETYALTPEQRKARIEELEAKRKGK